MPIDWRHLYNRYKGQWVALANDEESVIAAACTAKEVRRCGVPGSQTVLDDLGVDGHPPATALRLLGEPGK
jgi:hypothetical protein